MSLAAWSLTQVTWPDVGRHSILRLYTKLRWPSRRRRGTCTKASTAVEGLASGVVPLVEVAELVGRGS